MNNISEKGEDELRRWKKISSKEEESETIRRWIWEDGSKEESETIRRWEDEYEKMNWMKKCIVIF